MGEITVHLNDNRNGPIEQGDVLMWGRGRILAVMSLSRHMGMGPSAQACIRQVCEQFIHSNRGEVRQDVLYLEACW